MVNEMKPLTFRQWRDAGIQRRVERYGVKKSDDHPFLNAGRWWSRNILPYLQSVEYGTKLPLEVCRSIADNGGGFSLGQIQKHYDAIPMGVDFKTGRLIK